MVVLKGPLDWSIISRLSKDYDFYEEFGRTVVRMYPRHIKQPGTEAQRYTWWHFGVSQIMWNHLPIYDRLAWKRLCVGSTWRSRDYYMHLALKVLGNPGYTWVEISNPRVYFFPHFMRILTFVAPSQVPKIRFRWDAVQGKHSPVYWSPVGHKIRNRRVYRTWTLSDGLSHEQRFPTPNPPEEWWFDMYYPATWSRFWYRIEWDYLLGPAIFGGWTGLYVIDNPLP